MKKFYSLVLMAAALLIGTNAWADVTDATQLQQAINNAGLKKNVGTVTITLGSDITIPQNSCIWLGTDGVDDDIKSINLELNGFNIKMESTGTGTPRYMFVVSHGELLVTNQKAAKSQLILKGNTHKNSAIFYVYGSYKSSRWTTDADGNYVAQTDESKIINTRNEGYFTHVEIGEKVELYADGCNGTGIVIDAINTGTAPYAYGPKVLSDSCNYRTDLYEKSYGLAQGVRVDIKGDIDFSNVTTSASSIKSYGIKLNGNVWNALDTEKRLLAASFGTDAKYFSHYADRASHTADTIDAPYIHIYPGAHIKSSTVTTGDTDNSTAVYVAGYGKVRIDGAICEGNTALYASSGDVDVNDATLHSTATAYTTPQSGGSANGGGSTLVLNSRDGYGGGINITITGDTKITSDAGYAIESRNNTSTDSTKVEGLHIESATIEGGDMGAIIIEPKDDSKSTIVVANITGEVSSTDPSQPVTLEDLVPGEHHTVVVDGVTVVTPGAVPAATNWATIEGNQGADKDYSWSVAEAAVIGDGTAATKVTLGNLEMNAGTSGNLQSITIKDNATLEANYIMMNDYARIIVEAGGTLIVKGANGIYSNKVENIVLETQDGKPAIFILNPAVSFNTHPKATVELISKSYYEGGKTVYQRFGIPTYDNNVSLEYADPSLTSVQTYIVNWDYVADNWSSAGWTAVPAATGLNIGVGAPFTSFELVSNNVKADTMSYVFKGALVGNGDGAMMFNSGFNPYANSYMAPLDIATFLNRLAANNPELQASIWVYEALANDNYTWRGIGQGDFEFGTPDITKIAPMQAYMLNLTTGNTSDATISYKYNVYNPYMGIAPNAAPARGKAANQNYMNLNIANANGEVCDFARIIEDGRFSNEFDNGYDVTKFMNEKVNMYVSADDAALSTLASDDVLNTMISVNVAESGVYTLNVGHNGLDYALIDLENNNVIELVEGNAYNFYQEAGKAEARFQVIKVNKVATDFENTQDNNVLSTKVVKDGVLYIIKNGVVYNAQGQEVK